MEVRVGFVPIFGRDFRVSFYVKVEGSRGQMWPNRFWEPSSSNNIWQTIWLGFPTAIDKVKGELLVFVIGKLGFTGHPLGAVGDGTRGGLDEWFSSEFLSKGRIQCKWVLNEDY
jgi:hypothetical protein